MPKYTITIDMPEPKACSDCPFDYDGITCVAVYCNDTNMCKHHDCDVYDEIEKWCPLVNNRQG